MKQIVIVLILFFAYKAVSAESPTSPSSFILNFGTGISNGGNPIYQEVDYFLNDIASIGFEVSYRAYDDPSTKDESPYHNSAHYSVIGLHSTFNFHFTNDSMQAHNWDVYGGFNAGYFIYSLPNDQKGNKSSGAGIGVQFGIRHFFSNKFGLNLEGGLGNQFYGGKLGVTFKM